MPAKSQAQYRFMKAAEEGYIHPKGLSKDEAADFTQNIKPSKLPRFAKLKKKLKGK